MKRIITLLLIIISVCVITGCKQNENNEGSKELENNEIVIKALSLEDEEYAIAKSFGAQNPMIFSVSLTDHKVNKIDIWVDQYINGELVNSFMQIGENILSELTSGGYKIYFSTRTTAFNKENWILSVRDGGNMSSSAYDKDNIEFDTTLTLPIDQTSIALNNVADLGLLVRSKVTSGDAISTDIEKTIKENSEVYVIRCKFN